MPKASWPAASSRTARTRAISRAVKEVADYLGNTPTICRKCYVHPEILQSYMDGTMLETSDSMEKMSRALLHLSPLDVEAFFLEEATLRRHAGGDRGRRASLPHRRGGDRAFDPRGPHRRQRETHVRALLTADGYAAARHSPCSRSSGWGRAMTRVPDPGHYIFAPLAS